MACKAPTALAFGPGELDKARGERLMTQVREAKASEGQGRPAAEQNRPKSSGEPGGSLVEGKVFV